MPSRGEDAALTAASEKAIGPPACQAGQRQEAEQAEIESGGGPQEQPALKGVLQANIDFVFGESGGRRRRAGGGIGNEADDRQAREGERGENGEG